MNSFLILIVLALASSTQAFSLFQTCPTVKAVEKFDVDKVMNNLRVLFFSYFQFYIRSILVNGLKFKEGH